MLKNFKSKRYSNLFRSHWFRDLKRHESNWQQCIITSCSKICQRTFATIQKLENSTFIVLRNIDEMRITRVIDNIIDAKHVGLNK